MTDREQDERDLEILKLYESGESLLGIMRRYGVSRHYLGRLIKEALG